MSEKTSPITSTHAPAPLVTAFDRITMAVRDLAEAEAIYTRILGRDPSWRHTDRPGGTDHVHFDLDNLAIELVSPIGPGVWGQQVKTFLDARGEGIFVLFLRTDDVVATAKELTARGLETIATPEGEGLGSDGSTRRWRDTVMSREATRDMTIIVSETLKGIDERRPSPIREGVAREAAISALDHVVVMTSDGDACKKLFGDQFGIRLALDHSRPEWGVRQLFFRLGGVTLEVVEPLDKAKAPKVDFLWGMAWKTNDIRLTRERLVAEGAEVTEVARGRKKDTEVATIRPPTGGVPTLLIGTVAPTSD
ncbi:MAG: VOC family protein [Parvibaculum sp.]|nr:VOC family protein [Parvibaculum sp.]